MTIVCYGDSNTWGYDPRSFLGGRYPAEYRWPELLAQKTDCKVVNMGINGLQIPNNTFEPPENTDMLLIMLGTNDLLQGSSADETAIRMEAFLRKIPFSPDRIVMIPPPALKPGEWVFDEHLVQESLKLSSAYEKVAASCGIRFINTSNWDIPLCYDGVHFTESGNTVFSSLLSLFVSKIL